MRRLFTRSRSLLLVVALGVAAAMCAAVPAHAASSASAGRMSTEAPSGPAASSAQCNFVSALNTCVSTDPTVAYYDSPTGNIIGCTFAFQITWGDGGSSTATLVDPPAGHNLVANHTYTAPGVYNITVTVAVTVGTCTATNSVHTFTLTPSPKIHWSRTSGLPGNLVTLTGSGWAPGGIVKINLPDKKLFIGITSWSADSHGTWKESFAEGDAPPGTYKLSFSESSGHLLVTSNYRVLDSPNLTERFSNWVDACYHGQLKSDPLCTDALDEAAHLKLSFTGIADCVRRANKAP